MPASLTILLVGGDTKLPKELDMALAGIAAGQSVVVHQASDFRQGLEAARSRQPDLVLVEMTADLAALRQFADEMAASVGHIAVAAVFHPSIFGPDVSESAIIIEAIRAGVRDFLRRPLSSADLEQLLDRLGRRPASRSARLGTVVSFISNKGGVGKSTMAVNTACGLARRQPRRVLLIDASLQLGVCAAMLDLQPATTLTDAVRQRDRLDETLLRQLVTQHACGLDLLAAPTDAVEAGEVDDEVMARVLTLARRSYDFVVVDSFPLVDRVMMAVLDLSDRVLIVLENMVPTVLGGVKLCALLDSLGVVRDKQRIVLNRYARFAGHLRPTDVAERLGREIDYVVPFNKKQLAATNLGQPLILHAGRWFSSFGRVAHRLVDDVAAIRDAAYA